MRIIVCIKQVPDVSELKFDLHTKRLIREGMKNVVNPFDRRAIAEAVRIRDKFGGEVVVMTMGPPQAEQALLECLAVGADRAIHLLDEAFAGADTLATSRALAMAIRKEGFDIVFCGKYSVDAETGQVGPELAEFLNIPQVCGARKIKVDERLRYAIVERETDDGYEIIECKLPALFTAAERLIRPVKIKDTSMIEQARSKPIKVMTASDLTFNVSQLGMVGSPTRVTEITTAECMRKVKIIDGTPQKIAHELTEKLLDHGLFGIWKAESGLHRKRITLRSDISSDRAVWVVAELSAGNIRRATLELLGKGRELSAELHSELACVLVGNELEEHVKTLSAYGADTVYLIEHELMARYNTEHYVRVLTKAIRQHKPHTVLVPSTANGRDFAPRVAARLQLGLTGDCIALDIDDQGRLVQIKPAFGGNIIARIFSKTFPQVATVRPGILEECVPDWSRKAEVIKINPQKLGVSSTKLVKSFSEVDHATVDMDSADVIVAVGMGIGGPENLPIIREFANVMGASIGASRRVVDAGWLPRQHQIGLTGHTVSPQLYIAVGVRGNVNHTIGMQKTGMVVAINTDPEAEIFGVADYGIFDDFGRIVPALTDAISKAKQRIQSAGN